VVLGTCRAAGVPENPAKAQEMFKAGEVKVPRSTFLLAMASALQGQAALYSRNKLDDPAKLKVFCERAQEALKSLPESTEAKDLESKIQKTLKANKV
jgi:hypothetical protein